MAPFSLKLYKKLAKGFHRQSKNCTRNMIPRVHKALKYAFRDRRYRRRVVRSEWIASINSAVREHNVRYNQFIAGLNNSNIKLDRKILSQLAVQEPYSFKSVIDEIKIQGKIEIEEKKSASFLEAYAKKLLIDGPVKQANKQIIDLPYPFFMGEREQIIKKVQEIQKEEEQIEKYYKDQPDVQQQK